MEFIIFYCNKTYNAEWLGDKKINNPTQFNIINKLIDEIVKNKGMAICQEVFLNENQEIKKYVVEKKYKIIPSGGQEMSGTGRGIRHAKYAPSKSVAVLWGVIDGKIYVTFDDHAPVKYHRAIYSFQKIRLGKQVWPMRPKSSRRTLKILNSPTPWIYKGIDLRKMGYSYKKKIKRYTDPFEII